MGVHHFAVCRTAKGRLHLEGNITKIYFRHFDFAALCD